MESLRIEKPAKDWQRLHNFTLHHPIATMIQEWRRYPYAYRAELFGPDPEGESFKLADDYVLGTAWADVGKAMLALLNGPTGKLDCGTVDGFIRDAFTAEGFDDEGNQK